jgi:hypothetical protein
MTSDHYQMGFNDASEGREYEERPEHFTVIQWLDYVDGVRSALAD